MAAKIGLWLTIGLLKKMALRALVVLCTRYTLELHALDNRYTIE